MPIISRKARPIRAVANAMPPQASAKGNINFWRLCDNEKELQRLYSQALLSKGHPFNKPFAEKSENQECGLGAFNPDFRALLASGGYSSEKTRTMSENDCIEFLFL